VTVSSFNDNSDNSASDISKSVKLAAEFIVMKFCLKAVYLAGSWSHTLGFCLINLLFWSQTGSPKLSFWELSEQYFCRLVVLSVAQWTPSSCESTWRDWRLNWINKIVIEWDVALLLSTDKLVAFPSRSSCYDSVEMMSCHLSRTSKSVWTELNFIETHLQQ